MGVRMVVESPGMLTTVQDLGRYGYQKYGMPVAGAMDSFALQVANILAGNPKGEAGLEITFAGFSIRFEGRCIIAVTGADLGASLNGSEIKPWQSLEVKEGDLLTFTQMKRGCRAYLAVQGGIDVPQIMGSKSTYTRGKLGGYRGRKLERGDILQSGDKGYHRVLVGIKLPEEYIIDYGDRVTLRVVMGPQADYFDPEEIEKFLSSEYRITPQYDRMGYRLEGPVISHRKGPDIISDGIALGAVQVPGHGQPIIMMADRQTTGGYAKIATVISADIPYLAQLKIGNVVRFARVSVEEAHSILKEREELIRNIMGYVNGYKNKKITHYRIRVMGKEFKVRVEEITG